MSPKLQRKLLRVAFDLRNLCDNDNKHISFILDKNKIISFGYNHNFKSNKFSQRLPYYFGSRHSELHAYSRLRDKSLMPYLTLVNIRMSKTGKLNIAKPCPICMGFFCQEGMRPRKLYFTDVDGQFKRAW